MDGNKTLRIKNMDTVKDGTTGDADILTIESSRFGEISVPQNKIITMMKPVLGFESHRTFVVVEREDSDPFVWFQSLGDPEVAFLMINPVLFFHDYAIEVNRREVEDIEATDETPLETFVIITVGKSVNDLTANLQGPIVINPDSRKAKQLVLTSAGYSVAQPLFSKRVSESAEPTKREMVQL